MEGKLCTTSDDTKSPNWLYTRYNDRREGFSELRAERRRRLGRGGEVAYDPPSFSGWGPGGKKVGDATTLAISCLIVDARGFYIYHGSSSGLSLCYMILPKDSCNGRCLYLLVPVLSSQTSRVSCAQALRNSANYYWPVHPTVATAAKHLHIRMLGSTLDYHNFSQSAHR